MNFIYGLMLAILVITSIVTSLAIIRSKNKEFENTISIPLIKYTKEILVVLAIIAMYIGALYCGSRSNSITEVITVIVINFVIYGGHFLYKIYKEKKNKKTISAPVSFYQGFYR